MVVHVEALATMFLESCHDTVAKLVEICEECACGQGRVDEAGDSQLDLDLAIQLARNDCFVDLDADAVDHMLLARLFTLTHVGHDVFLADLDDPLLFVMEHCDVLEGLKQDERRYAARKQ